MLETAFSPLSYYSFSDLVVFALRIVVACLVGGILGIDRGRKEKGTGPRTHCIIAATACLLMTISKYGFPDIGGLSGSRGIDNARMAATVISSVSFVCASVIFKNGSTVKGLTTAACLWSTAAVGLAIGCGMYISAAVMSLIILVTQRFNSMTHRKSICQSLTAVVTDSAEMYSMIHGLLDEHGAQIKHESVSRKDGKLTLTFTMYVKTALDDHSLSKMILGNPDIFEISVETDL